MERAFLCTSIDGTFFRRRFCEGLRGGASRVGARSWGRRHLSAGAQGLPLKAASLAGLVVYVNGSGSTLRAAARAWSPGKTLERRESLMAFHFYVHLLPINDNNKSTNGESPLDSGLMD